MKCLANMPLCSLLILLWDHVKRISGSTCMKAKNMEHNSANLSNITRINKNLCSYWNIWFFFWLYQLFLDNRQFNICMNICIEDLSCFKKAISSSTYFWMTKWRKSTAGLTELSQASSTNNTKLPFWNSPLKVRYDKTARWKEALRLLWRDTARKDVQGFFFAFRLEMWLRVWVRKRALVVC